MSDLTCIAIVSGLDDGWAEEHKNILTCCKSKYTRGRSAVVSWERGGPGGGLG